MVFCWDKKSYCDSNSLRMLILFSVYIYIYILGSDLYILKTVLHEVVCRG